jgi:hypothetical protein
MRRDSWYGLAFHFLEKPDCTLLNRGLNK